MTILSSEQRLENSLQDGGKQKKMQKSNCKDIEEAVLKWLAYARSQNASISVLLLKKEAVEISREMVV